MAFKACCYMLSSSSKRKGAITLMKKRTSTRDTIRKTVGELDGVGFEKDPEFVPGDLGSAFFERKSEGEIVKDRLIASYRNADGWYAKLDKDIGGNEWAFKDKITSYDHWVDLQLEICNWVREKTKLEMQRTGRTMYYGSGRYRISFWNSGGNRDQEYHIIPVDANEWELDVPKVLPGGVAPGPDVNELLKTIQGAQLSPSEAAKQQFESMKMGMEMAKGKEERGDTAMATMMTGMITMMGTVLAALVGKPAQGPDPMQMMQQFFGLAKDTGIIKTDAPAKEKSYVEMIGELRALGIKVGSEQEDMSTTINKVKSVLDVLKPFMGSGEGDTRSFLERFGEAHGGKILDLLNTMFQKAATTGQPNVIKRQPLPPVQQPPQREEQPPFAEQPAAEPQPQVEQPISQENAEMFGLVSKFAKELREAVTADDFGKFPYITETISKFTKNADMEIKIGNTTADDIIGKVMQLDGDSYSDPSMKQKLVNYVQKYVEHVRSSGPYYVLCKKCNTVSEYGNKQEFIEGDKVCGANGCTEVLQAMY